MSFHKQQKCFGLQPLTPSLIKAPRSGSWEKKRDLGWGWGRRCRKSRAYLWKNPGYVPACVVQKWRKTLVFVSEGSVITHQTSFELLSKILRKLCHFWVEILWIVFNTLQQQSLIASLEMRSLLLVAVWCLQKDVNVFSTKGNVSRNSDLKNIPAAVTAPLWQAKC